MSDVSMTVDDDLRGLPSVIAAVARIDEALGRLRGRTLVEVGEVSDLLLDVRRDLEFEITRREPT